MKKCICIQGKIFLVRIHRQKAAASCIKMLRNCEKLEHGLTYETFIRFFEEALLSSASIQVQGCTKSKAHAQEESAYLGSLLEAAVKSVAKEADRTLCPLHRMAFAKGKMCYILDMSTKNTKKLKTALASAIKGPGASKSAEASSLSDKIVGYVSKHLKEVDAAFRKSEGAQDIYMAFVNRFQKNRDRWNAVLESRTACSVLEAVYRAYEEELNTSIRVPSIDGLFALNGGCQYTMEAGLDYLHKNVVALEGKEGPFEKVLESTDACEAREQIEKTVPAKLIGALLAVHLHKDEVRAAIQNYAEMLSPFSDLSQEEEQGNRPYPHEPSIHAARTKKARRKTALQAAICEASRTKSIGPVLEACQALEDNKALLLNEKVQEKNQLLEALKKKKSWLLNIAELEYAEHKTFLAQIGMLPESSCMRLENTAEAIISAYLKMTNPPVHMPDYIKRIMTLDASVKKAKEKIASLQSEISWALKATPPCRIEAKKVMQWTISKDASAVIAGKNARGVLIQLQPAKPRLEDFGPFSEPAEEGAEKELADFAAVGAPNAEERAAPLDAGESEPSLEKDVEAPPKGSPLAGAKGICEDPVTDKRLVPYAVSSLAEPMYAAREAHLFSFAASQQECLLESSPHSALQLEETSRINPKHLAMFLTLWMVFGVLQGLVTHLTP
ncbi:uncharacterized protein NEMAJ01_0914 [Nematocida major]|uniref:uncharacterized protein n=1 Tax=Nematocida major TaxID=1912982 RepID=UPI002007B7DE|nr:uncharacterized protein NEMAJ01_0914 [Nematocida major]KAH9386018.1 hypothetical protein NEMAJ01_0914 [Nematocida major]